MDPVKLEQLIDAQNALQDAVSAVQRTNERGALDVLEASAVEYIVKGIDRLLGIEPLGPAIAHLFSPITNILDDLAGDPTQIYAHCDLLERQASALREMSPPFGEAIAASRQAWSRTDPEDSNAPESCRTRIQEYGELFPLTADVLQAQSGVVNQVAVTVVKTKVQIMNLVTDLVWDLIELAFKLVYMPWQLLTVVGDVTNMVLSVLYKVRDFANTLAAEGNGLLGQQAGLARAMRRAGEVLQGVPGSAVPFDSHSPGGMTENMRSSTPHADDDLISDLIAIADGSNPPPEGWDEPTDEVLEALGVDKGDKSKLMLGPNNQLWEVLTDEKLAELGVDMGERNGDGFGGTILRGPDGQLVVKFDGTDFHYAPDVIEDGVGGVTMSEQSVRAMEVAEQLRRSGHGDNVVYTGSSLGGRLAAVAALSQGGVAVTFNAAGVSPGTMEYLAAQRGMTVEELYAEANEGSLRCYRLDGEILTDLQEKTPVTSDVMPDAPGQHYTIPNNDQTSGMDPVEKHTANAQMGQAMRDHWEQMRN